MNKKKLLKKTTALLVALGLTVGAIGCDFIVVDSEKDLRQTVATVNIASQLAKSEDGFADVAEDFQLLVREGGLSTQIPKRDLVAYFLNVGYTYVQNYGYTYEATFNMLMDSLVESKIYTQYAVAYYLEKGISAEDCIEYVNSEIENEENAKVKSLLNAHREILTMKYFLTDGNSNAEDATEDYDAAVYGLLKSINSSLDSMEQGYITAKSGNTHTHGETRTLPTNANTAKSDYVPMKTDIQTGEEVIDYGVYTGRNTLDSCGAYKDDALDGSTATTRKKAYNSFLSNLQGYGLIKSGEDTSNVLELDYYYMELSSALSQALVNKFGEDLQEEAYKILTKQHVEAQYDKILEAQEYAYKENSTAFDTALDGLSDTSFVLYGKKNFGFVYNILIPFSASQEQAYSAIKNKGLTQDEVYTERKELLKKVTAKDLRSAWFCTEENEHYAYEVSQTETNKDYFGGNDGYLFFENNFEKSNQYETIKQYAGKYAYNGVAELVEGEWKFTPRKMDVDGFIDEMESYIEYAAKGVSADPVTRVATTNPTNAYEKGVKDGYWNAYNTSVYTVDDEVDYGNFVYYEGKVDWKGSNPNASTYFDESQSAYKALSAVNELMFAYSTDTGCLNTYMGYAVTPYKTDFVGEFEYAAQLAVRNGVGSYVVAPSDYGWHIIYCSFSFGDTDGAVYGGYDHLQATGDTKVEGSFSNLFYEALKTTTANSYVSNAQNNIRDEYKSSATYHKKAYQDLLDLD